MHQTYNHNVEGLQQIQLWVIDAKCRGTAPLSGIRMLRDGDSKSAPAHTILPLRLTEEFARAAPVPFIAAQRLRAAVLPDESRPCLSGSAPSHWPIPCTPWLA